jgi:2'-5' RNA ligase
MPNRNAYLRVALGPAVLDGLAALAAALAQAAGGPERFRAMDRGTVHMTFFFAGERLGRLDGADLARFHAAVSAAVGEFHADASTATVRLRGLALFPPGKHNLVVARFAASPALRALQARIEEIAAAAGVSHSGSVRHDGAHEHGTAAAWLPHVTLGKVRSASDLVETVGRQLLAAGARIVAEPAVARQIESPEATGIDLGGLAPKQRWLDWDLQFARPEPELEPESEPVAWRPKDDPRFARVRTLEAAGESGAAAHLLRVLLGELDPLGHKPKLHAHLIRLEQLALQNGDAHADGTELEQAAAHDGLALVRTRSVELREETEQLRAEGADAQRATDVAEAETRQLRQAIAVFCASGARVYPHPQPLACPAERATPADALANSLGRAGFIQHSLERGGTPRGRGGRGTWEHSPSGTLVGTGLPQPWCHI